MYMCIFLKKIHLNEFLHKHHLIFGLQSQRLTSCEVKAGVKKLTRMCTNPLSFTNSA